MAAFQGNTRGTLAALAALTAMAALTGTAGRVEFCRESGRFLDLPAAMVEHWRATWPSVNVPAELERAACWLLCRPGARVGDLTLWLARRLALAARRAGA